MDFFEKYEKKYFPSLHSARYTKRISDALALKTKAMSNPEEMSWEEIRKFMRVLKHKKILPNDPKANDLERQFMISAFGGTVPSIIAGSTPYLLKEFHKIKKRWKKLSIAGGITVTIYSILVSKPLMELNNYSRIQAQKYASFLVADD